MVRQHVWLFEKRESKIKNLIADIHQQFSNKNSSEQVQSIVNEEVANQIVSQAQAENKLTVVNQPNYFIPNILM